jgi:hypothetical protein
MYGHIVVMDYRTSASSCGDYSVCILGGTIRIRCAGARDVSNSFTDLILFVVVVVVVVTATLICQALFCWSYGLHPHW